MSVLKSINPTTEELYAEFKEIDLSAAEAIIEKSSISQIKWSNVDIEKRSKMILEIGDLVKSKKRSYAEIIVNEMGKPITEAIGEIDKCVWLCEYYAENASKFLGDQYINSDAQKSLVAFEPLGVILGVMPWNFPFWQALRFAVPNLMAGNGGLLKHAPNSTGTALEIERLFRDAGFPKDLFRSVVIDVPLASAIIAHPAVAGVTLTGSERAGSAVAAQAGQALKKVVLELGGSDPYLILKDADLDLAAKQCATARLSNSGQVCIAAKRIIVVDQVHDAFLSKLEQAMDTYVCGDPNDPNTTMGPMARADLRDELHHQVQASVKAGATLVRGGAPIDGPGYFYPATLLTGVRPGTPAATEELFGPVVCVMNARDENEAIAIANDTPYGLGAAVYTQDVARGEAIARDRLQAGTCNVNCSVYSDPRLPFGGIKRSGYGRELAGEGIREFMNTKTVVVA